MTQHTTGPWKLSLVDDCTVIDASGEEVACVCGYYNQPDTWTIMEANARLIAAAPDMLKALKELVAVVGGEFNAVKNARAAIAKAEGRS